MAAIISPTSLASGLANGTTAATDLGLARVMVVGDSISHGMEDYLTWRWRLFHWMQNMVGVNIQFVGPWRGTFGPVLESKTLPNPPLFPGEAPMEDHSGTTGRYNQAVPAYFASDHGHACMWGRQIAQSKTAIEGWFRDHQPNYLLVMLGFNDLVWFVSGPEKAVNNMGHLVDAARRAKPDIKILIGNIVHRTFIDGRQDLIDKTNLYNQLLRQNMGGWWFRWESPLVYVDVNSAYNCRPHTGCPDAYDGLHPNTMGEYHIAQAFANALRRNFTFTGPEFQVPANPEGRPISTPSDVRATSFPEGIKTQWPSVRDSRGYDIQTRIQGMTTWWSEGPVSPNSYASWNTWFLNGQVWESQVRTRGNGNDVSGWSAIARTTANLQASPGPSNIVSNPIGSDVISISWSAVNGYNVNRYGVIIWDRDTPGSSMDMRPTTGTSMTITGVKSRHRYSTWVAMYVNLEGKPAGGVPAGGREVFVGRGTPAVPGGLRIVNKEPTTVVLNWNSVSSATGYAIYIFNVATGAAHTVPEYTTGTQHEIGVLFPGTWNHRFCVTAYNGFMESGRTATCVVPPRYPGYKARDVAELGNDTVPVANSTGPPPPAFGGQSMFEDENMKMLVRQMMIQEAAVAINDTQH